METMKTGKSLTDKVREHIKFEENTAKLCADTSQKLDNAVAKMLLTEMSLDSTKHARILEEVLNTVEKAPPAQLWDYRIASFVDTLVMKKTLEKHLEIELRMLKKIEEMIKTTKDEALKLLLEHIAADERKHHKIIKTILRRAYVLTK